MQERRGDKIMGRLAIILAAAFVIGIVVMGLAKPSCQHHTWSLFGVFGQRCAG